MFLMFHLGREDVLAVGDLGIRRAIERLYGFEAIPRRPRRSNGSPSAGARTGPTRASTSGVRRQHARINGDGAL